MASLQAMRDAMAETLRAHGKIGEITYIYDSIRDAVEVPCIIIDPEVTDFDGAMGGADEIWTFNIFILTSRAQSSEQGQRELDEYLKFSGDYSVREALWNKPDLGLEEDVDAHVYQMRGYGGSFDVAKIDHVGAVLRARVHTDGRQ